MSSQLETQPRKMPTQERSRFTVEAMIEATARIVIEEGLEALSTNRVSEVAGVSVGTLYQYFPSKEALLAAVIERELREDIAFIERLMEQVHDLALREFFEVFVAQLLAHTAAPRRRALHRVVLTSVAPMEREELVRQSVEQSAQRWLSVFDTRREELAPHLRDDDAARHVALMTTMIAVEGALNHAKTRAPELLGSPHFQRQLVALFCTVLDASAGESGAGR